MSILEGLFFGTQIPFDEVDVNSPEYYRACDKMDKIKAEILEKYPDLEQLMEELANTQMEQTELGRFHEFSVGVRVGAQLMIEMLTLRRWVLKNDIFALHNYQLYVQKQPIFSLCAFQMC